MINSNEIWLKIHLPILCFMKTLCPLFGNAILLIKCEFCRMELEEFLRLKGICQRDFLSPYLFVICLERLFHLINVAVGQKTQKHIQLARGDSKLTHCIFANDIFYL